MPEGRIKLKEPNLAEGKKAGMELISRMEPALKGEFSREFVVTKHKVDEGSSSWGQEISIRKGANVGAGVEVDYSSVFDSKHLKIEVSASTKTGNVLFYIMAGLFAFIGCFIGDFYWDSVKLGALVGLLAGVIIGLIAKYIAGKGKKQANEELVEKVWQFVQKEFGPLLPGKYDSVEKPAENDANANTS